LVIACNTATTFALPALQQACAPHNVRVFGVIEPGVDAALACHRSGTLAVLGTEGTIAGGAYEAALRARAPDLNVVTRACPLFVPLVEEGWLDGEVPRATAESYLADLRGHVQTAILGCTHYPLLRSTLEATLPGVTLIDSATATAAAVQQTLHASSAPTGSGTTEFRVTDHLRRFQRVGARFLRETPEPVTWIDLSEATGSFALKS
jgi:glutamate racemase